MDIVTKSQFEQFKNQFSLYILSDNDAFELFVIYCVVSRYVKSDTVSKDILNELNVGNGNDWGIDGAILIVNGKIVTSGQEINDLLAANNSLHVHILLVQAKTSGSFDVGSLGKTLDGAEYLIKDILGETTLPCSNDDLTEFRYLLKYVYSKSADFTDNRNPRLSIIYATCGAFNENSDFSSRITKTKEFLLSSDLLDPDGVECHMLGKKEIVQLYKETKSHLKADIKVEQKITLPDVPDITESYLCLVKFSEFKKLIVDEQGDIRESVFNDNIRAYQGENAVNKAMAKSLHEGKNNLFTSMNNGVTIIAKSMRPTGMNIHLSDYQIVNGCQTSNVLYRNMHLVDIDNLQIIVKLIASNDKDIQTNIIVGNNSQTEVKREQLVSLLESQKAIEDYFIAQNKYEKLYYERRSKQYKNGDEKIPQYRIVTIPFQIKAFVSMILGEPDKVGGYYGSIVEEFDKNGQKVFSPNTNPALYYTSALACYRMTECFTDNVIGRKYKRVKYHLLLAFRLMCEKFALPEFNHNKIDEYCEHLCIILSDKQRYIMGFTASAKLVDIALKRNPIDSDRSSSAFTKRIKELAREANEYNRKNNSN